jgi:NAD(P)H dehydrogenase (quinone)
MKQANDTIFVTGAAGHLGRLVIKHLLARGVAPSRIIAGTREPQKFADLVTTGIDVRRADFDDASTLADAFRNVGTLLIISTDAIGEPGKRLTQHRAAVAAAKQAGVGRIAYTSLPNPGCSLLTFAPDHAGTEQAIEATGLPYVFFRNSWYQENLLMALPNAFKSGHWYSAGQGGRTSYVAREDIAEAIAVALAAPEAESRKYTLTGPEAVSNEEIAKFASEVAGKPLEVVHVSDRQLAEGMKAAGVPDAYIPFLVSADVELRAGNLSIVTDHLQSLIGRAPKRLTTYLEEAKGAYAA